MKSMENEVGLKTSSFVGQQHGQSLISEVRNLATAKDQ